MRSRGADEARSAWIGTDGKQFPADRGVAEDIGNDEQCGDGDQEDRRNPENIRRRHIQPGLRYLVGAHLRSTCPKAVDASKDGHGAKRDDDGRHAAVGDDEPIQEACGEPDHTSQGDTTHDADVGMQMDRRGRSIGCKTNDRGHGKIDAAGDHNKHLGDGDDHQQAGIHCEGR